MSQTQQTAMDPGHAEVEQVWPRDGHVLVIGHLVGAGRTTTVGARRAILTLTNRDRPGAVLRCPATLDGERFEASVDVDLIAAAYAAAPTADRQIWDLHLTVPGVPEPLRVGRHLDDIVNKKKVMTFPAQNGDADTGAISVKPYYTDYQNLSLICRTVSA
ncbi:hypothetical protein [Nonomuraea sp. NPDC049784]|uniref:hypothetical protein n=1 Tax=Nonomuraea sp. NPDC049784 TaxID=3154361 RepID=UPI0033E46516